VSLSSATPVPYWFTHPSVPARSGSSSRRPKGEVDAVGVGAAVDDVDRELGAIPEPAAAQPDVGRLDERDPERAGQATSAPSRPSSTVPSVSTTACGAWWPPKACGVAARSVSASRSISPSSGRGSACGGTSRCLCSAIRAACRYAKPLGVRRVVLEHEPLALGVADDVQARDADPRAARRLHAAHLRLVVVGRRDDVVGHHAFAHDPLLGVGVGDERVQRAHPAAPARA
jgi:hypothetical protein